MVGRRNLLIRFLISIFISLIFYSPASEEDRVVGSVDDSWTIFRGTKNLAGVSEARLPAKLSLAFKLAAGDGITSSPVIWDRTLFIGALDGTLSAFDLDFKRKLWEMKADDAFEAPPLVVPALNTVFIGAVDGSFLAVDARTGTLLWRATLDGQIMGSANYFVTTAGQKTAVVVGSYDNLLYCFDALSGKINWSFRTDNYVNGTPAISGDVVAFGGCDARLRVLDLASGKERGAVNTGAYIAGSVALIDGVAYVGNYGGRFLAIDTNSLSILWSYTLKTDDAGFVGSPAVAGRFVVIGAKDSLLYCFDRKSGALLWKYRASAEILSSPLIGGDRVFIAASDGELSILELAGGAVLSTYELGAGVKGSPAFASGLLAIGALDGNVYVFKGE